MEHCGTVAPSRIFRASLGSYMTAEPDRPFSDFYEYGVRSFHHNLLGYDAMADMIIHHIKVTLREAVEMLKKTKEEKPVAKIKIKAAAAVTKETCETTKTHEACGSRMHPVRNEGEPANRCIRGL